MQAMPAWTCLLDIPLPLHSQIPMVAMKHTQVRGYSYNEWLNDTNNFSLDLVNQLHITFQKICSKDIFY